MGKKSKKKFLKNYIKQQGVVGKGTFGEVYCYKHVLTQAFVAIKTMSMNQFQDEKFRERLEREVNNMRKLNHPNIVKLFEFHEDDDHCYFVLEYAARGELFDYIKERGRLQEDLARQIFQQLVGGIEYCHREGVVHRDLKPENILLDRDGLVKICDFGLSNVTGPGVFLGSAVGSPNYAAPELLSGFMYFGPEVDIWSLGCILYTMLFGELPFSCRNRMELYHRIRNGKYKIPHNVASKNAVNLIQRMICTTPERRIDIAGIRKHPWFNLKLPRYLARPYMKNPPREVIHEDTFKTVCQKLGKRRDHHSQLRTLIEDRKQTDEVVLYQLMKSEKYMKLLAEHVRRDVRRFGMKPIFREIMDKAELIEKKTMAHKKQAKNLDDLLNNMVKEVNVRVGIKDSETDLNQKSMREFTAGWSLGQVLEIETPLLPDEVFAKIYDVLTEGDMSWQPAHRSDHKDSAYNIIFTDPENELYPEIGIRLRRKNVVIQKSIEHMYLLIPYYVSGDILMMTAIVPRLLAHLKDKLGLMKKPTYSFPKSRKSTLSAKGEYGDYGGRRTRKRRSRSHFESGSGASTGYRNGHRRDHNNYY